MFPNLKTVAAVISFGALAVLPAHAGDRVALIVGNAEFADQLARYGFELVRDESPAATELTQQALERFRAKADKAEFALLYYRGAGGHDNHDSYLFARDGSGGAATPFKVATILEGIASAKASAAFLDISRDAAAKSSMQPGLGALKGGKTQFVGYTAESGLEIAGRSQPTLGSALVKRFSSKTVKLRQVAALTRDDVVFESGGSTFPWTAGAMPELELENGRLMLTEFIRRACPDRAQVDEGTIKDAIAAYNGSAVQPGSVTQVAASNYSQASDERKLLEKMRRENDYCPFSFKAPKPEPKPEAKPDQERKDTVKATPDRDRGERDSGSRRSKPPVDASTPPPARERKSVRPSEPAPASRPQRSDPPPVKSASPKIDTPQM